MHQKRYDDAVVVLREAATNIVNHAFTWPGATWAGPTREGQYTDAVSRSHPVGKCSKGASAWATTVSGKTYLAMRAVRAG